MDDNLRTEVIGSAVGLIVTVTASWIAAKIMERKLIAVLEAARER